MFALYTTPILLLGGTIVRVIEYMQGNVEYILLYEDFLYTFDALLMLDVMVIIDAVHPGNVASTLKERENSKRSMETSKKVT